jgi:hypothetical protein
MASWEEWAQQVGGKIINSAADAKFTQPYELQKLQLEALGSTGVYTEGQPQATANSGLNPTWLLIGGAVVVLLMLRD